MDVTVITPTVPERSAMLAEAVASVNAQTLAPVEHLIGVDHAHDGPAAVRTRLTEAARTEWVAYLDDDDLLDPHHLETLAVNADGADVVYPWCRLDPPGAIGAQFYNQHYDRDALRQRGIFPITVLVRRLTVLEAGGGFRPEDRYEDWAAWNRIAERGGRFACVPEPTWTYRFHGADQRTHAA